jgi:small-conductance mechanosensitive channel
MWEMLLEKPLMTSATLRLAKFAALVFFLTFAAFPDLLGQERNEPVRADVAPGQAAAATAPVEFNGRVLFRVRGVSTYAAEQRSDAIAARIQELADDREVPAVAVRVFETNTSSDVMAGSRLIAKVFGSDAELEGTDRALLAEALVLQIRQAIMQYRSERSARVLWTSGALAAAATLLFALVVITAFWLRRRINALIERRLSRRIQSVQVQSFQILRAEQIWKALQVSLDLAGIFLIVIWSYLYVQFVLGLFPWTRPIAERLLGYLLDPLALISRAIAGEIPNLILIACIVVIARYVLKAARSFFAAIGRGNITFSGFDRDWAIPTYKILRVAIIAFAAVIAYPYIPGSDSAAFKGISIFLGVILSLGSSSVISNIIAGHTMTYRRAYKLGDRIKIENTVGDVVEMHLLVTHLRTLKNEVVAVPNSLIMNSQVVNYSALSRERGLILHRTIGIGYEFPWQQVEAMLLEAAGRTPGIMEDPAPFVLQLGFSEYCISYELNVYCDNVGAMPTLYTTLDRSILDVFNEHGVQIVTPAYMRVVPEVDSHAPPAPASAPRQASQKSGRRSAM